MGLPCIFTLGSNTIVGEITAASLDVSIDGRWRGQSPLSNSGFIEGEWGLMLSMGSETLYYIISDTGHGSDVWQTTRSMFPALRGRDLGVTSRDLWR